MRRARCFRASAVVLCASLCAGSFPACSKAEEPVSLRVTGGMDVAPFDGAPAVADVELRVRLTGEASERTLARAPRSAATIDVPEAAWSGVGTLALAGVTGGSTLVYGRTPPFDLGVLATAGPAAPIALFVQRAQTITRALRLPDTPSRPRCSAIGARYLAVGDGSTHVRVVDLLSFTVQREDSVLPSSLATLVTAGGHTIAIDGAGNATSWNRAAKTTQPAKPPPGFAFTEVVFGAVVETADASYVVGATRASNPTDAILRLGNDGTLTAHRLARPRTHAAATFSRGRGLVVAFGLDEGSVEVLAPGATVTSSLPFAAEKTRGGVLVPLEGGKLLRIEDTGQATTLDLACVTACVPAAAFKTDPASRDDDHATAFEDGSAVVVRGGRVSLVPRTADRLITLHDTMGAVCSSALSTGVVAVAIEGDDVLRTVAPGAR